MLVRTAGTEPAVTYVLWARLSRLMACGSAAAPRALTGSEAVGRAWLRPDRAGRRASVAVERSLSHSRDSPCFLLALLWKPVSLQLYPLPLVGSQTYKMYKCNLVDFIKIILILKYKQTTTTTTKHTKVLQFLC